MHVVLTFQPRAEEIAQDSCKLTLPSRKAGDGQCDMEVRLHHAFQPPPHPVLPA